MRRTKLPDRWEKYLALGGVIPGTPFIACKVPLKDHYLRGLPKLDRFGPKELVKRLPNLAVVIDLTNTTVYYAEEEFLSKGVKYEKVSCPGHVLPPNSVVQRFYDAVGRYWKQTTQHDKLIAVHCTHGLNRTGYFICRYMIEKLNMVPEQCLEMFNTARGHNIERKDYIEDLQNGCKGGPEHTQQHHNRTDRLHRGGRHNVYGCSSSVVPAQCATDNGWNESRALGCGHDRGQNCLDRSKRTYVPGNRHNRSNTTRKGTKGRIQLGSYRKDSGLVDKSQTLTGGVGGNEGFDPARLGWIRRNM